MTSLYDIVVPTLTSILKAEQHLLTQAEAFAAEKGTPISEILELRIAPDMWPLSQQIMITALHTGSFLSKVAGLTPNKVVFGPGTCLVCFPFPLSHMRFLRRCTYYVITPCLLVGTHT